jgi:spore coat polysaccharide biosynthesis predicted glycosyltransferase SpsG/RimJ/RimL family protein N-acetyltransferase
LKVAIITEGLIGTGSGHITRCVAINQAFNEVGIIPYFIVNCDDETKPFIQDVHFIHLDWLNNIQKLLKIINGFDFVFIDSYLAPLEVYQKISTTVKNIIYLDDYLRLDYPPGIIINGTVGAENFPYKKKDDSLYLLGINFIPIRKEFWDVNVIKKNISEIKNILITFGSQDNLSITYPILNFLLEKFPKFNYQIILGNKKKGINTDKKNVTYHYTLNAQEMIAIMQNTDIAITAAGQTTFELARLGVPTIAIGVADNQYLNIKGWREVDFIDDEIWFNDVDILGKIKKQLLEYINKNCSAKKILCDGQGARRIIQATILKNTNCKFYLRKFIFNDVKKIYNLSNDNEIRKVSINQNNINWEEHQKWFNNKLNDSKSYYLIAHDYESNFIGQIKFDVLSEVSIISISISNNFRGKGLGSKLLRAACKLFFYNYDDIGIIEAYIESSNIQSIKSFLKVGFILKDHKIIDQRNFNLYILNRDLFYDY